MKFTNEDFIYIQLNGRKDYFKNDLKKAANSDNFKRVKECYKAIEIIDSIQNKIWGVV